MNVRRNDLGQPVGAPVEGWAPPPRPPREPMIGTFSRLEPLEPDRHATDLFAANSADTSGRMFTYLSYGPFDTFDAYVAWLEQMSRTDDPLFFVVIGANGKAVGVVSYLRIDPANGVIEVGHIAYSPALQRTREATEAIYLMMRRAFTLGYRRFEWKCDSLNAKSRAAAQRLGLSYEGTFRQAIVYKGRTRDTAWYAAIDDEWPSLDATFRRWLDPANFDALGQQRLRLADLTAPILKQREFSRIERSV
jgi:RimJ/RimL family protein N-acetyltransferase